MKETVAFQAETKELLNLVVHSLYTNREIFLRELVSNASDALDKRRVEALRDPDLSQEGWEPEIRLEVDPERRVLRVVDNGIGMSRGELVESLGTIARSGTKDFLAALRDSEARGDLPELIGQFGVGFYSSFMVADRVVVETRRLGEEGATRWSSAGGGDYVLEESEREMVGTTVSLHLKPVEEEGEDQRDFAREDVLREVVKRYSDFIAHPIRMETGEGDERKLETLNSQRPLWTRPRHEIEDSEYAEFYRHVGHDFDEPLETIHFKAEGATEYTALLFLPKNRPFHLFDPETARSRVHLYVKRVFVMADCEELVPPWLRFVPGVVDAADLPLNVSREMLQESRQIRQIKKRVTRKVIDTLRSLLAERREDYVGFWRAFGPVVKEGVYYDDELRDELVALCLFRSSKEEGLTTLGEYVERMPVKQKEIYVLLAPDEATAQRSPHAEALFEKGYEVLWLVDSVDEFALQRLQSFQDHPIRQIDKGEVELGEEGKTDREAKQKELEPLLESARKELADRVESVRFTDRLTDSPACLVSSEHAPSPQLLRYLRESGQNVPEPKRVLELNASHQLVQRMVELQGEDAEFARFGDWCELLYGQALVAEGSPHPEPKRFTELVTNLMLQAR